jgi:predicted nucleotidyltransferase component of viral defense system
MKNDMYLKQASLILRVLPHIYKEECFALKGGTAINFFIRDFPRLSVDIDLALINISERNSGLMKLILLY